MTQRRKTSFLSTLKDFDAYAKPLEDFQVKTMTGASLTLISVLFIVFLLISEFVDWKTIEFLPSLQVDHGRKEKMTIHLNISFPHMPCFLVSLDVMDVSGDHQNDVDHDVFKQRLSRDGYPIHSVEKGTIGDQTSKDAVDAKKAVELPKCGNCYGAGEANQCCNTCEEVRKAYAQKGWTLDDITKIDQCVNEGEAEKLKEQMNEGCNLHGTLQINKVAGNFHFAPGRSFQQGSSHVHDLHEYMKSDQYDWTHTIHEMGFGENLGFQNPLDKVHKDSSQGWSNYQYYVKVVRTDFFYRNSTKISTNQFSVTEHESITPPILGIPVAMPGVFFNLEISPMLIIYKEYRKPFSHFLTDTCAIVGGIITVAGIIDGILYSAERRLKQKMEIGKAKFQLQNLQNELEQKAVAISDHQLQAKLCKQQLAEKTKAFKKSSEQEKLEQWKPLLKAYQLEIDHITTRARYSETLFLELYQKLSNLADPVPLLESFKMQNEKLSQLDFYMRENERLKNQLNECNPNLIFELEAVNSTLHQRLKHMEESFHENLLHELENREKKLKSEHSVKIQQLMQSEQLLERQLMQLRSELMEQKRCHLNAQEEIVLKTQKDGMETFGQQAELNILLMDIERYQYKIVQLEHENESLKKDLNSMEKNHSENECIELQTCVNALKKQLMDKTMKFNEQQESMDAFVNQLKIEQDRLHAQVLELNKQLHAMKDYEELKDELKVMKNIEFHDVNIQECHTIEQCLQLKIKKLENEITSGKMEASELKSKNVSLQDHLMEMKQQLQEKSELISHLEADLLMVKSIHPTSNPNFEELITHPTNSTDNLIQILTSQRDRLVTKYEQLQLEFRNQLGVINQLNIDNEKLAKDNVKMFEKLKYLESFKAHNDAAKAAERIAIPILSTDVTTKYQPIYESTLDPFKKFHKQEVERRLHALNPAEKAIFILTKMMLTNKYARWVFACYLVCLHVLVLLSMHHLTITADKHQEMAIELVHAA